MRSFPRVTGVLTLSVLLSACSFLGIGKDDIPSQKPTTPEIKLPESGGLLKTGETNDPAQPTHGEGKPAKPVISDPVGSLLVGTWDYAAVIVDGQQQTVVGSLTLNADNSFQEEMTDANGTVTVSTGTYGVENEVIRVKGDNGSIQTLAYEFGEAEKDGLKKTALTLRQDKVTYVLIKRVMNKDFQALVGSWEYALMITNNTQYSAVGTLVLNDDGTFEEEVSINNQPSKKREGTFVVDGTQIRVRSAGRSFTLLFELGEAEKNGVKSPALTLIYDKATYILVKKQ